jgi:hypothetical protein
MKSFSEWRECREINENYHQSGPINPFINVTEEGQYFHVFARMGYKENKEYSPLSVKYESLPKWVRPYLTKNNSNSDGSVRTYEIEIKLPKSLSIGDTEPGNINYGYGPEGAHFGLEKHPIDLHYLEAYFSKVLDFDNPEEHPFGKVPKNSKSKGWGFIGY